MPIINKSAEVSYTAANMFDLVNDVESYPEFIHWITGADILHRDEDEVRAKLILSVGGVQKSFTTSNRLQPHKMIEIKLLDGPFHRLEGYWRFEDLQSSGSKVMLALEFEFSNKLIAMAIGPMFQQVAGTLVDSFLERAKDIYGP